jgi:hypothetical protein
VVSWFFGAMGLVSKDPSSKCVSGTLRGASSADKVAVKDFRAALTMDSGAWNGGFSDGIMAGVKTRSFGCGGGFGWYC